MDNQPWEAVHPDDHACLDLAGRLGVSPLLAGLLINRGVTDAAAGRRFLAPDLADLADPFDLPDMDRAAARLAAAVAAGEKVLVYGDYDADGVSAAALLTHFFRRLGLAVETHLPCRFEDGYGLHAAPLEKARRDGCALAVSVDCGCDAGAALVEARAAGLDVIVTDHHLLKPDEDNPGAGLPAAVPHVNPRRPGTPAALAGLAGVGVAFELARAVARQSGRLAENEVIDDYLDLVAAGTIADRADMRGENRLLVHHGLARLGGDGARPAFREILRQAGRRPADPVTTRTVGFVIGPLINAAGRMGHASDALALLLGEDEAAAAAQAGLLARTNRRRQRVQKQACDEAAAQAAATPEDCPLLVLAGPWHPGVAGIVAGKLAEQFAKPAFVFCPDGRPGSGRWRGSGRSAPGIDIFAALESCRGRLAGLEAFGGHRKAVGVTLRIAGSAAGAALPEGFLAFRDTLAEAISRAAAGPPGLRIEARLGLEALTAGLVGELAQLAPHGKGNAEPLISSPALEVQKFSRLVGRNHLRLWLSGGGIFREGIAFNLGQWQARLPAGTKVDVAYTPRLSSFNGFSQLELDIKAFRAPNPPAGATAGAGPE